MNCGNGSDRAQHPVELFGSDWLEFGNEETSSSKHIGEGPIKGNSKKKGIQFDPVASQTFLREG